MAGNKNTPPDPAAIHEALSALLADLSDARCVLECAVRCLEAENDEATDEAVCLRHGLDLIARIYDVFDMAVSSTRVLN